MKYSIAMYSEVSAAGLRLDAEYWHPNFIQNAALVSAEHRIQDFVAPNIRNIKSSPINRDFEYLEISKIPLDTLTYETTPVAVGEEPDRAHHILEKGDVVVSTVRPNRNAVALIERDGIIGSSGLAVLRAKGIEPEYLFAFCKTNYFIQCLVRANKATMYPAVAAKDILDTPLFLASNPFRERIVEIIGNALSGVNESKAMYAAAQTTLLSELNLADWQPRQQSTFVRNFADLGRAGRMDSDYFQPKYAAIEAALKSYRNGYIAIREAFAQNESAFDVIPDELYHYVEIGSVNVANGEITPLELLGKNLPTNAKRVLKAGDVIVSKVRTYRGAITIVPQDGYVGSGAFCVLQEKGLINKETLQVFLNSKPLLAWSLKPNRGTEYPVIVDDDILDLPIPIITPQTQAEIQAQVAESSALRRQSRQLLELAKGAVELAIEQDETAALAWLEREMGELLTPGGC